MVHWKRSGRRSLARGALVAVVAALVCAALAESVLAAPTIRFRDGRHDRFKFHGRVPLMPPWLGGPVDPVKTGFGILLFNDRGVIYAASVYAGDLQPRRGNRYQFKDHSALRGLGTRNGLFLVITRFRKYGPDWYYTVRVRAFADFSSATDPWMTVVFNEVDGTAGLSADWVRTDYGWRLPLDRFAPAPPKRRTLQPR